MPNITPASPVSFRPHAFVTSPRQDPSADSFRTALEGIRTTARQLHGPYYSSRRERDLQLNGEARVGDIVLFCRQLSVLWERSLIEGKPDYRHFSSVEHLQAHAPHDIADITARRGQAELRFVENAAWGQWISATFKSMDAERRALQSVQIHSRNHAMAIGLRIKMRQGRPCYVVKFYDPNRTATHQRTAGSAPDAFARLTALDFLEDPETISDYGMAANSGSVVFLGDRIPDHAWQPVHLPHVDAPTLMHLLHLGLAGAIARFGELVEERRLDARDVAALLTVKSDLGVPVLFTAMWNNDADSIRAYGDVLLRADLAAAEKAEVLACRTGDGTPGLNFAMQEDNAKAIRAWGELLLQCKLDPTDMAALLSSVRHDGTPCLHMALSWDCVDAIREFGTVLLKSGLSTATVVELLEAKDSHGTPALLTALRRNRMRAIRAFGDIVAASGLGPFEHKQLLCATTALSAARSRALLLAQPGTRRAYFELTARLLP